MESARKSSVDLLQAPEHIGKDTVKVPAGDEGDNGDVGAVNEEADSSGTVAADDDDDDEDAGEQPRKEQDGGSGGGGGVQGAPKAQHVSNDSPTAEPPVDKQEQRARGIVHSCENDFLATEQRYVEVLERLLRLYRVPLQRFVADYPACGVTPEQLDLLLPTKAIEYLLKVHKALLEELEVAVQAVGVRLPNGRLNLEPLAKVYNFHAPCFQFYKAFLGQSHQRKTLLGSIRQNEHMSDFHARLLELEKDNVQPPFFGQLEAELDKPMQRVMRYSLLLGDLQGKAIKCELVSDADKDLVTATLAKVKAETAKVNLACGWVPSEKVRELLDTFDTLPPFLTRPSLNLRDSFYKASNKLHGQVHLYLLDDCVLVAKPMEGRVKFKFLLLLRHLLRVRKEGTELTLATVSSSFSFIPETSSPPGDSTTPVQTLPSPLSASHIVVVVEREESLLQAPVAVGSAAAARLESELDGLGKEYKARNAMVPILRRMGQGRAIAGFPSATMGRDARLRCILILSLFMVCYIAGAVVAEKPSGPQSLLNKIANTQLHLCGYLFPPAWVFLLHIVHARDTATARQELRTDILAWFHLYMIARFVVEPLANIMCPLMTLGHLSLTVGENSKGVASHALMTFIAWGYAMLASDRKWFSSPILARSPALAGLLALSLVYLLGLYGSMAFITAKYFHTFPEVVAAAVVAVTVLSGYVMLYDRISKRLQYCPNPGMEKRALLRVVFIGCGAFVFLLSLWIGIFRFAVGNPEFRLHSMFWFALPRPVVVVALPISGAAVLYTAHRSFSAAMFPLLWIALAFALCTVAQYACAYVVDDRRVGGPVSAVSLLLTIVVATAVVQARDVASHLGPLMKVVTTFATNVSSVTWTQQAIVAAGELWCLVYFLLYLQLLAQLYSAMLQLYTEMHLLWCLIPVSVCVCLCFVSGSLRRGFTKVTGVQESALEEVPLFRAAARMAQGIGAHATDASDSGATELTKTAMKLFGASAWTVAICLVGVAALAWALKLYLVAGLCVPVVLLALMYVNHL